MRNYITIDHRRICNSFSHLMLFASAACNFSRPSSKRVSGHTSIICLMVCTLPHSQFCVSVRRHLRGRYWHLPFSVLIRFNVVHEDLGRLKPDTLQCVTFTNSAFFTPEVLQLFFQISSSEHSQAVFSQTGCLDFNLSIGTFIISLYTGGRGLFFTLSIALVTVSESRKVRSGNPRSPGHVRSGLGTG